jgi:hypothetical protein
MAALLTPLSKGWGTDMGVELTGTAIQVHGGMGFIEETGVAQHYRDARITTIYEGTNGIQGMDLVGRKLGMKGGKVVLGLLDDIDALVTSLPSDDTFTGIRRELASASAVARRCSNWLMENSKNPVAALSGATPYLRVMGMTVGGYLMAASAKKAAESGMDEKVATARFFCEQLLPQVAGLEGAVTGDSALLMSFDAETLAV